VRESTMKKRRALLVEVPQKPLRFWNDINTQHRWRSLTLLSA